MTLLGDGRKGYVELRIKNWWEGDVQLVVIKDQDNNDIATLLSDIKVMKKTDVTIFENNVVVNDK